MHLAILTITLYNWTKTFYELDKYFFKFEQIHFAGWSGLVEG